MIRYEKNEKLDFITEYLPKIKRIEELPVREFREKSAQTKEEPSAKMEPEKESEKARHMLFSADRFQAKRLYQMDSAFTVQNLIDFIKESEGGKRPMYFQSRKMEEKNCQKIVGDDFENVVYKSAKDCVVLFEAAEKEAKARDKSYSALGTLD